MDWAKEVCLTDSWRCSCCGQLIYNVEWQNGLRYPVAGAPLPHFVSSEARHACVLCFFLHQPIPPAPEPLCLPFPSDEPVLPGAD
jgi:hypothetical protein